MSLLHPASAGAAVTLWFVDDLPVRVVHASSRYSVLSAERTDAGWAIVARSATGQTSRFDIHSRAGGWQLARAS